MPDSLFNIIIVLIPVAIFIGRIVAQARSKRNPAPPARQRPIPVHFEDDEDDERQFSPSAVHPPVQVKKDNLNAYSSPVSLKSVPEPPKKAITPSLEPEHGFLYLSHLSPMKQAVVLAEILGPPKGME